MDGALSQLLQLVSDPAFHDWMYTLALSLPRIMMVASFAPFFAPGVSGPLRLSLCLAFMLPLMPLTHFQTLQLLEDGNPGILILAALILKEAFIGLLMGYVAGLVFYAAMNAGMIADNQRGASQALGSDILTGDQNSPFGSVLFLSMVVLFFSSGGCLAFVALLYQSYAAWPVASMAPALWSSNASVLAATGFNRMMELSLSIGAPFIIAALLCDISLGLINRFAPQLNVFVISMAVKSGICAILALIFISPFAGLGPLYISEGGDMLKTLMTVLASSPI